MLLQLYNFLIETLSVVITDVTELSIEFLGEDTLSTDFFKDISVLSSNVANEILFPINDLVNGDLIEETVDTSKDDGDLGLDRQGRVLRLLQ